MDLNLIYSKFNNEEVASIDALGRSEKIKRYAFLKNVPLDDALLDISNTLNIPILENFDLIDNPTSKIPLKLIHEYRCIPIKSQKSELNEDQVALITLWPSTEKIDKWIFASSGKRPVWYLTNHEIINDTITQNFGVGAESLDEGSLAEESNQDESIEDEDAAIIKFVNEVILKAVKDRATDIHFEPKKDSLQIRYRIDGELIPIKLPANLIRFQGAIISRLKIMAKLNISEKRRPQDGRITFLISNNELDIRISTFPTMFGESISLRLLNQESNPLTLKELGLSTKQEEIISNKLKSPHGIILVTGPTGSGKSTSLTAFMRLINQPKRRIITVEDPVEYEVPGINQTQVHPEIGLTFAKSLRSVLRQDPDVIMVGEIRDKETADIAVRASLTGHLVLSTLHTNDAPGALTRLIDMEIEPFLIASTVELILAQRLVRKLCPLSKYNINYIEEIKIILEKIGLNTKSEFSESLLNKAKNLYQVDSKKIEYKGRIGIFESLVINDAIHEKIIQKASAKEIRQIAIENGMNSLMLSGLAHVQNGITSIEEIMRYSDFEINSVE